MKRTNIYLAEGQAAALDRVAEAEGVFRAELIREPIDRAIGGHPGADLAADLAAINDSFGALAGQEAFSRTRDHRMAAGDQRREPDRDRRRHAPARTPRGHPMFPELARPF
jgi:hypothetical protein